jgi:hypothetical protein
MKLDGVLTVHNYHDAPRLDITELTDVPHLRLTTPNKSTETRIFFRQLTPSYWHSCSKTGTFGAVGVLRSFEGK